MPVQKNIYAYMSIFLFNSFLGFQLEAHSLVTQSDVHNDPAVPGVMSHNDRIIPTGQEADSSDEENSSFDFESDSGSDNEASSDNEGLQFTFDDEDLRLLKEKEKQAPLSEVESILEQLEQLESDITYLDSEQS